MSTIKKTYRFGIVSCNVILDPDITLQSKALYAALACYANKQRTCFPSISTLSNDLNVSERTIKRLIKELKNKKIVVRTGRNLKIK
ncbi:MAG: DNA-binding MarR family transcriptional regulator [Arcobacteraceae bacterium]|jgi:DNA-binding MarR family transcriptional regulator|tara:strand:+ start:1574 stop:1831 length:258 start_codon:yes stop_codon:yes gene_type:complete